MGNEIEQRVGAGVSVHQSVGGSAMARSAETSAAVLAEQAKANVLARFQMARLEPRDTDTARMRILKDCERPRFAELAEYELPPRGGKVIRGPSVRLAEVCARAWGNIGIEAIVTYEDDEKRLVRVIGTDYETNATYSMDISVTKVMERRYVKDQSEIISQRINSEGKPVYVVRADETSLLAKHNALVSKARRNVIFCIVPGDIVDEALERAARTVADADAKDPDAERRRIFDGFAKLSVEPKQLGEALGVPTEQIGPAQLVILRKWYAAIRDGETTLAELLSTKKAAETVTADGEVIKDESMASATGRAKAAAKHVAARAGKPDPTHGPNAPQGPLPDRRHPDDDGSTPNPPESDEQRAARIDRGEDIR